MKKLAIFLVVLIIGTTPAFAVNVGEITQTADLAVRGRGVAAASEITEAVESRQATGAENETLTANTNASESATVENNDSMTSTDNQTTGVEQITTANDDPVPAEATGADMQVPDLNGTSENYTIENSTIPQIDTTGIVMQSTDYSCGPAALATVLQNMGINSTEQDLKGLAGTDTSGTSMYGLARAAKAKGVNAVGMRLSIDDLRPNHIVHVILNGTPHYSVVREITETSVYLADPSKGNIVLSREEFSAISSGTC